MSDAGKRPPKHPHIVDGPTLGYVYRARPRGPEAVARLAAFVGAGKLAGPFAIASACDRQRWEGWEP